MEKNKANWGFLRELKRRRVLHTASLYVVGSWVALQVVEVLSGAGLPPTTMRNLLVLLSVGFPFALVIGWFFDISKEGVSKTGPLQPGEQLPDLKFIDIILLAGLLIVMAVDAYILSFPKPEETPILNTPVVNATDNQGRTIVVLGFEDIGLTEDEVPVGKVFADELRSSLMRVTGLRVLGPETSRMLKAAGEARLETARELLVTAILLGDVLLDGGKIQVNASLVGIPAGNELWSSSVEAPVGDSVALQNGLVKNVVGALAPSLDPDPVHGPRAEVGACSEVYDIYLRGKRLSQARRKTQAEGHRKGMELLREAVRIDENCALAWEALAEGSLGFEMAGYVNASAAARRALELNESLPAAWMVLAEVAEDQARWMESEEYFLKALYMAPTDASINGMYGETLVARGRAREALDYMLRAYRYEPASAGANLKVAMAAHYNGEADLAIKHYNILAETEGEGAYLVLDGLAEAYLLKGETDKALEYFSRLWSVKPGDDDPNSLAERHSGWVLNCVRVRDDPGLATEVSTAAWQALEEYKTGQLDFFSAWVLSWRIARCGTWLGEPDLVFEILNQKGLEPFKDGYPTEVKFINMFHLDGSVLRQDPRFRDMVVESGLLDYWRRWGWADLCEPDGDGFRCD